MTLAIMTLSVAFLVLTTGGAVLVFIGGYTSNTPRMFVGYATTAIAVIGLLIASRLGLVGLTIYAAAVIAGVVALVRSRRRGTLNEQEPTDD
jgi:hypothetical protein